jgi:Mg-chelatase subunit ChlD
MRLPLAVLSLCLCVTSSLCAQGSKPVRLKTTTPASLVDCAPVTQVPCMSAGVTPVDEAGLPAPVTLPAAQQLAHALVLHGSDKDEPPFYASAGSGPDAQQHSNVALLLIDISGSMNQPAPGGTSRFLAVKNAVAQFLTGMQDGTDRIAIVPFESHNVTSTIHSAVYVNTKADAMAQLNAMPAPANKNNTALYQAVFSGVQSLQDELGTLEREGHLRKELQPHLIVMTDGKNEVLPGDDPQLLNGDLGLQQAAAQVSASHMDVIGVGFGDRAVIDAVALQRLSSRFFYAADATQLLAALHSSRSASSHEIQMTWLLPEDNRLALMGHDPTATPELQLEGGARLQGEPIRLTGPATGAPVYTRKATASELQALIATQPATDSGWSAVLVHYLLALGACALVLLLWFWVPRLVWGERYTQALPQRSRRWSSDRPAVTSASGVQIRSSSLPAGFETAPGGGPVQRSAAQTTQIQPRGELSRTRLTFDQK